MLRAPSAPLAAHSASSAPLAAHSTSQCPTNTAYNFGGAVSCQHSYDDPAQALKRFQPPNVPTVLPAIAAMLFAVVLNRYFDVLPAHVQVGEWITELVADGDLRLRSRQPRLDQDDAQPRLFR